VTISGTAETGATLTAISTPTGDFVFTGVFTWQWADSKTAAESVWNTNTIDRGISGQDGDTLTLDASLEGKYIRAKRNDIASKDEHILGPVTPPSGPRITISGFNGAVAINGTPQMLTATSSGGDFTGDFTWEYRVGNPGTWNSAVNMGTGYENLVGGDEGCEWTVPNGTDEGTTFVFSAAAFYIRATRTLSSGEVIESDPVRVYSITMSNGSKPFDNETRQLRLDAYSSGDYPDTNNFIWEWADEATATVWNPVADIGGTAVENRLTNGYHHSILTYNSETVTALADKYVRVRRIDSYGNEVISNAEKISPSIYIYEEAGKFVAVSFGDFTGDFSWEYGEYIRDESTGKDVFSNITPIISGLSGDLKSEWTIDTSLAGKIVSAKRTLTSGTRVSSNGIKITAGGNTAPIIKPSPSPIIKQPVLDSSDRTYADAGMSSGW
jgi:hypothetical protein